MGRQDNVEIFEDTQRLCSSNERLISAIKNSSAGQQCFSDKGRHWYGARISDLSATGKSYSEPQTHSGSSGILRICRKESVRSEFCISDQSGRRRDQGLVCTGRGNMPLLHALSEPERTADVESVLFTPSACP